MSQTNKEAFNAVLNETEKRRKETESLLNNFDGAMQSLMPANSGVSWGRWRAIVRQILLNNPLLENTTPRSRLISAIYIAKLGLNPDPNVGLVYVLPFKNEAKPVLGYKGMIELARRSGLVVDIAAQPIFQHDFFEYHEGTDHRLVWKPYWMNNEKTTGQSKLDDENVIGAFSIATFKDGHQSFKVIGMREIQKAQNASPSKNSSYSPWKSGSFPEMAAKTAIRRHANTLPQSPELAMALMIENSIETGEALQIPDEILEAAKANPELVEKIQPEPARGEAKISVPQFARRLGEIGSTTTEARQMAEEKFGIKRLEELTENQADQVMNAIKQTMPQQQEVASGSDQNELKF
jgi:recombination protein RecT